MEIKTLFVGDTDVGKRLDVFLSNELEDISRSRIKSLIENGDVLINNKPVTKSGISIKKGEIYTGRFTTICSYNFDKDFYV